MMDLIATSAAVTTTLLGIVALLAVGLGVYWLVNKQARLARLRDIAAARKRLEGLLPSDPEYGAVRALYTAMVIDAHRWGILNSDGDTVAHSGGEHASDHPGGGGDQH